MYCIFIDEIVHVFSSLYFQQQDKISKYLFLVTFFIELSLGFFQSSCSTEQLLTLVVLFWKCYKAYQRLNQANLVTCPQLVP